jgi:serine/threonine-protein kinase
LNRLVAVKLLPADRAGDEERIRRFTQEARTASALNHPNIVTIYEIPSQDSMRFIAMEYVQGKSLDGLIPRKGMRLGEALKIANFPIHKSAWPLFRATVSTPIGKTPGKSAPI